MEADIVPLPHKNHWSTRIGIKMFRYKGLVKRYWWLLLLTVSIGLAWQGWQLYRTPVRYQSYGTLLVTQALQLPDNATAHDDPDQFYGTQLRLFAEPEIFDRAAQRVALDAPDLAACKVDITTSLEPRTAIFSTGGLGTNAAYTQRFVQAFMEEAIRFKNEKLRGITNSAEQSYNDELKRLSDTRDKREQALQDFIKQNNVTETEQQSSTAARYLADLKARQAALQTELERLQTLSDKELLTQAPQSSDPKTQQPNEFAGQYSQLSAELAQKKSELAQRAVVWKPAHPRYVALKEDIARLEAGLTNLEQQNRAASQVRISAIQSELGVLLHNIDQWTTKAMAAGDKVTEYQRLKDSLTQTSNEYDRLLSNINVIETSKATPGSISIIKNASRADLVDPGTAKHLAIGFMLGLALGVLILAIMDKADDRVSSSTEVMEHFSEPIMGQIPNIEESRAKDGLLPLLGEEDERYTFAESFRSLRSSLLFMPNQGQVKSMLVTSSIPGEGKSTISANLAITMAMAGTRVLLVDADLRRGDISTLFNVDGKFGLSSILRDEMPWRSVVKPGPAPSLSIIPRGPVTNQSSELLLVPRFDELMKEWKSLFDLVLFNTSPILATDDTATIAPTFDGVLMVVRAQFTSARLVRNSLNAMYQRQVNVLGIVLNGVNTELPDYYYYRYPKYYAA